MNNDRIQKIYDELGNYAISLVSDPTAFGPRYLQDQIATCRNYVNSVTQLLLEVHRDKHNLVQELSAEEDVYTIESNDLLTTDERIKKLPSIDDRKAAISVLLRERSARIAGLRRRTQDLDYVEKAVRHRHRELKDTMSEIKLQRSLLRDELDTGSFYGDERTGGKAGVESEDDLNAEDIERLLEASEKEAEAAAVEEQPVAEPVAEPSSVSTGIDEDGALQSFLGEGSSDEAPKKTTEPDDYADIFAGIDRPSGV